MRRRRKLAFGTVLALLVVAALEGLAYIACLPLADRCLLYCPDPGRGYAFYQRTHDPLLGWPISIGTASARYAPSGARHNPGWEDDDQPAIVSLYGDSFTFSDTVSRHYAWGHLLSERFGARVDNFGVNAYSTAQAYLRFLQKREAGIDRAPVAVLCVLSENILRNVNRLRNLIFSVPGPAFAPAFELVDGELSLLPVPAFESAAEFHDLLAYPGRLRGEWFEPGSPAGIQWFGFPFSLKLLGVLGHYQVRGQFGDELWYAPFYDPDHGSNALAITAEILRAFARQARALDVEPLVVVLPHGRELEQHLLSGTWTYQPLLDALGDEVPLFDASPGIVSVLRARAGDGELDLTAVFTDGYLGGHFNASGYAIVAGVVGDELERRKLVVPR